MKKFFLFAAILITFLGCYLFFSVCCRETDNSGSFPPCLNNDKKWIIGYFQSGKSEKHFSSFKYFIDHLAERGWLEPVDWTQLPKDSKTKEAWCFLAENMRSEYLRIETRYFWCSNWSLSRRKHLRKQVLGTLKNKEVDLMLAMGTWPGQDLASGVHSTPTICLESLFPIKRLFKKSGKIPDHLYLPQDPDFLLRQIHLFKKITKFKTLGVVYVASSEGRFKASLKLLKQFSKEKNFKLVVVRILPHEKLNSRKSLDKYIKAHEKIAPQVDAMWLTTGFMNYPETAGQVLAPLFKYKIPTWYPHGEVGVFNGAVFGVIHDPHERARHYAETTAKIFNGVKPASQIKDLPINNHLVINCAAAKKIGLKIPNTLLGAAKKSYLNINTGRNK
jgi:ABC-type uncharacterized transport system substrate-binding protein